MKQEIKLKSLQANGIFTESTLDKNSVVSRKAYVLSDIKVEDNEERTFTAICATKDCDRDGEVVLPEGLNIDQYIKNPIMCFAHNYSQYTIGKCISLEKSDKLICKFWFAPTSAGEEAWQLVKSGCLNSVSIGFIRKNIIKRGTTAFIEAIKNFGIALNNNIQQITTSAELVEVSLVPIPCNREAIIQEVATKGLTTIATAMNIDIKENKESTAEHVLDTVIEVAKTVEEIAEASKPILPIAPIAGVIDGVAHIIETVATEVKEMIDDDDKPEETKEPKVETPVVKHYCNIIRKGSYVPKEEDYIKAKNLSKGKLVFK